MDSPDSEKWKEAMEVEMRSLQDHQVWDLVKLLPGKKAVGSKWAFKVKTGEEGKVERFKARMEDCKPVSTPVSVGQQLIQAKDGEELVDQTRYQSLIGSLMYLSICTRPDITYSVSNLARFSQHPTREHWTGVKRLLRYLKGTADLGILYTREKSGELRGFTDADWGEDQDSRRSTSGCVFLRARGAVSWKSRKQQTVLLRPSMWLQVLQHKKQSGSY